MFNEDIYLKVTPPKCIERVQLSARIYTETSFESLNRRGLLKDSQEIYNKLISDHRNY